MEILIDKNGESDPIEMPQNSMIFKYCLIGIPADGFDGNWTIEYSPNGDDWIPHEDAIDLSGQKTTNIFYQIPLVRVKVSNMSAGILKFYIFGG